MRKSEAWERGWRLVDIAPYTPVENDTFCLAISGAVTFLAIHTHYTIKEATAPNDIAGLKFAFQLCAQYLHRARVTARGKFEQTLRFRCERELLNRWQHLASRIDLPEPEAVKRRRLMREAGVAQREKEVDAL